MRWEFLVRNRTPFKCAMQMELENEYFAKNQVGRMEDGRQSLELILHAQTYSAPNFPKIAQSY